MRMCSACIGLFLAVVTAAPPGYAQGAAPDTTLGEPQITWILNADGEGQEWPLAEAFPLDSLTRVERDVRRSLQQEGYYLARIDSYRVASAEGGTIVSLYATRGPAVEVGAVELNGAIRVDAGVLARDMETRPGRRFDPRILETDLQRVLKRYETGGYLLAQARVSDLILEGEARLSIRIDLDEGPQLLLDRLEVPGAERTSKGYVARTLGLRPGRVLAPYDPDAMVQKLEQTTLFAEVGAPQLEVVTDSSVVLKIPITDASPGVFDLVLGYLPATQEGQSGMLVGNGHLELRNLFGGGRIMSLRLNRLPGQVSSVDVRLGDPSVFGLPFGAEGRFEGLQQDSTYSKQRFAAEVNYRFEGGMQVFATASREETNPGFAGQALSRDGMQRIPRSSAFFGGLGVRFRRLDRLINPRRGHLVEVNLERGKKERMAFVRTEQQDTTIARSLLRQQRIQATARLYVPAATRQVLALGGEAALLLSNEYDESDLFRFGGATSLRGYDEDFFRGSFVGRGFAEYRYLLDRTSYTYLFFDLGYVDVADELDFETRGFFPGFGLGIQFQTSVGLINASYAVSPDDGLANGRIHAGLSFGL